MTFLEILYYLRELNMASICLRIVLAMVVGGLLGLERGRKNRPAGFRTYMLVSLGAALVMMTNQYASMVFGVSDPVRMGAQVVSGIGFLGAGTIIVTGRNQVRGITTAAGLWTAACSGLAVGIGFYEGALAGGFAVYFVMAFMQRMDSRIRSRSRVMEVYIEFDSRDHKFSEFLDYARGHDYLVSEVQVIKNKHAKETGMCVVLEVKSHTKRTHFEMVEELGNVPGVAYLEEL